MYPNKVHLTKEWTYGNRIQGVVIKEDPNLPKPDIDPDDYE
ncbi:MULTISPECIES: hypothetical protein [Lactobacillus]|nr:MULTISPECIES: hypothetical protein [Lactobacillus]